MIKRKTRRELRRDGMANALPMNSLMSNAATAPVITEEYVAEDILPVIDNSNLSVNKLYHKAINYGLFAGSFKEFAYIYNSNPSGVVGIINQYETQQQSGNMSNDDAATVEPDPNAGYTVPATPLVLAPTDTPQPATVEMPPAGYLAPAAQQTTTPTAPATASFGQSLSDSLSKNLFGTLGGLVTTGLSAANSVQTLKANKKAIAAGTYVDPNTGGGGKGGKTPTSGSATTGGMSPLVYVGAAVAVIAIIGGIYLATRSGGAVAAPAVAAVPAPSAKK